MSIRRAISMLTAAILVAGCAHAGQQGGQSEEQASRDADGDEMETIDDALEVELEEVQQADESRDEHTQTEELDSRFWEKSDGISGDAVFGESDEFQAMRSSEAAPARDGFWQAHRAGQREALVEAIRSAPISDVGRIVAWREQLRGLAPDHPEARLERDLETIRRGAREAADGGAWARVLELHALFTQKAEELVGGTPVRRQRQVVDAITPDARWMRAAVVAAHHNQGDLLRAEHLAAVWVAEGGGRPLHNAVELAEHLAGLDAAPMARQLLGTEVLESVAEIQFYPGGPTQFDTLGRAVEVLGDIGGDEALLDRWAHRYLLAAAQTGQSRFRVAVRSCAESLGADRCSIDRVRTRVRGDATPDVKLACRFYQYRRGWKGPDEAKAGLRRFVASCGEGCSESMDAVGFGEAICSPNSATSVDVDGVSEALVAIPLQFGDVELALELLEASSASPLSKASVLLSISPTARFLKEPAMRLAVVDAATGWLDEFREQSVSGREPSSGDETGPVALVKLRIRSAEILLEGNFRTRARDVLRDTHFGSDLPPRMYARVVELLVQMRASSAAADLVIEQLEHERWEELEEWVTPIAADLPPLQALRVYRAAAKLGYQGFAARGLALAVGQNDIQTARSIVDAQEPTRSLSAVLDDAAETKLHEAAASNPDWARFYLRVLRSQPEQKRSRYDRIRIARVVSQIHDPDRALSEWESVFADDDMPCAALHISLRDGPGPRALESLIRLDQPTEDADANRLILSLMLRVRMRGVDGDPLALEGRHRAAVTRLAERIMEREPLACVSPIGLADIVAGHGFPEAALEVLDSVRELGLTEDRRGVSFEPVRQRFLEMRVALDIGEVERARRAIARVEEGRRPLRQALERELGWYLLEQSRQVEAADFFESSFFSLERTYVEEDTRGTTYEPLSRWRADRSSIENVDDALVELAQIRERQGRGAEFAEKLAELRSRSSLDDVRRRRLALRLVPIFDDSDERAAVLQALHPVRMGDRIWLLSARLEFVQGNVDRGFAKFDIGASKMSSAYSFWLEQAYWFVGRGQFELARTAMSRARRLGGDGPGLAVARGRIALLSGDDETALREFRAALAQLHLRTTAEIRVREAFESAGREDLIRQFEGQQLLERTRDREQADPGAALRLKKLRASLKDRRPHDAIGHLLELEEPLARRGQLSVQAKAVAELMVSSGHPAGGEFRDLLVEHGLAGAALVLAEADGKVGVGDAFRLWAYFESRVTRKAIALALRMLDPVSEAYDPDNALRLVGAFGEHDRLLATARGLLAQTDPLSPTAPYAIDALVIRGELSEALSLLHETVSYVEANEQFLTSAELTRWGHIQTSLVRRGLGREARAILGREPHAAPLAGGRTQRHPDDESKRQLWRKPWPLWRKPSALRRAHRRSSERATAQASLPTPETFGHLNLEELAPALLRAAAPYADQLVRDETLAERVESAPGHIPVTIAWVVTQLEAGQVEEARARAQAFLEDHGEDLDAVERLVSELGRRGFWSEIAVVVAPRLAEEAKSPATVQWVTRARGRLGLLEEQPEADGRESAFSKALRRPSVPSSWTRPDTNVIAWAMASRRDIQLSDRSTMDALRELGPLEQWCLAPETLQVVVEIAWIEGAPESDELEACARALGGPSASGRASEPSSGREAAYREGVRRGSLSPSQYHDYRIFRWRHRSGQ